MTKQTKPGEYGTAPSHGPVVIKARNNFIPELRDRLPRASGIEAENLVDYMIECRYLSAEFFAAWSFEGGDDDE